MRSRLVGSVSEPALIMARHLSPAAVLCFALLASAASAQDADPFGHPGKSNFEALVDKVSKVGATLASWSVFHSPPPLLPRALALGLRRPAVRQASEAERCAVRASTTCCVAARTTSQYSSLRPQQGSMSLPWRTASEGGSRAFCMQHRCVKLTVHASRPGRPLARLRLVMMCASAYVLVYRTKQLCSFMRLAHVSYAADDGHRSSCDAETPPTAAHASCGDAETLPAAACASTYE